MRHVLKKSINSVVSDKVKKLTSDKGLLNGIKRLGIAVSGGSDSMALLYIMAKQCRKSSITPYVLHFDHSLRGEASRQDALFVQDRAQKLGIEFVTEKASGIAQGEGKSLEMAAREARQAFFRRAIDKYGIDAIATGHHADDVAETLIMRLLRGAGTDGLSGLKPLSVIAGEPPIRFIRPLLCLRRDELRQWLVDKGLTWHEDATNADTSITRNNVRHAIIPFLCKESGRNDDPVNAISRSAEILREDDDCLQTIAEQWLASAECGVRSDEFCSEFRVQSSESFKVKGKGEGEESLELRAKSLEDCDKAKCGGRKAEFEAHAPETGRAGVPSPAAETEQTNSLTRKLANSLTKNKCSLLIAHCSLNKLSALSLSSLKSTHLAIQRRVIRLWLIENVSAEAAGFETVNQILSTDSGIITLPGEIRAEISGGTLRILPKSPQKIPDSAILVPESSVSFGPFTIYAEQSNEIIRKKESFDSTTTCCSISAAAVAGRPLSIRARRSGDRMAPYGISGTKKVKDIFIDAKLPKYCRDTQPLILCGDEIVWIPGYRIAAAYAAKEGEATILLRASKIAHPDLLA